PQEALIIEKLLSRLEGSIGVQPGTFKIKVIYEEGNAGRFLPAIAWVLPRRLLGTNVCRWDYLCSLIDMWKDDPEGVYPDPLSTSQRALKIFDALTHEGMLMGLDGLRLYDVDRQRLVPSPEPSSVGGGKPPLHASLNMLQDVLDAPREPVDVKGSAVPTVASR